MRVAAITMSYNESFNLAVWSGYYGRMIGHQNLFIVDDGSSFDLSEFASGANVIRMPRVGFDDLKRARMISHLQAALLERYDWALYTDTDELIVVDPNRHGSLIDYVTSTKLDYFSCIGLNVVHLPDREPPYDPSRPITEQRRHCRLVAAMCKTLMSRRQLRWGPGFHSCDVPPLFQPGVFLFHTKRADVTTSMKRLETTRAMEWADLRFGGHQRVSDEQHLRSFSQFQALPIRTDDFEFADIESLLTFSFDDRSGLHAVSTRYQADELQRIPDRFVGLF